MDEKYFESRYIQGVVHTKEKCPECGTGGVVKYEKYV